jgi:hypothetical protein
VWRVGGGSNSLVIFASGTIQVGGMSFLSLFSNPFLLGSPKSLISFIFEEAIRLFFHFEGPISLEFFFGDPFHLWPMEFIIMGLDSSSSNINNLFGKIIAEDHIGEQVVMACVNIWEYFTPT